MTLPLRAPDTRVDPELLALAHGLKPVVRVALGVDEAPARAALFRAKGLFVAQSSQPAQLGAGAQTVLYLARSAQLADEARDAEAPILPGTRVPSLERELACQRALGRALGYPRCCVDAHVERVARRRCDPRPDAHESESYAVASAAWVPEPDARLNHFLLSSGWRLLTYYPCRYDCPLALRYASALLERMATRAPAYASALLSALARPVLVDAAGLVAVLDPARATASASTDGDEGVFAPPLEILTGSWPPGPDARVLRFRAR